MTIALVSGQANNNQNFSGNSVDVIITNPPAAGHLVCAAVVADINTSAITVVDANSNSYTLTPQGIKQDNAGVFKMGLLYLPNAPANANQTITCTATGSASIIGAVAEFSGAETGPTLIDTEAFSGSATSQTNINAPSATPSVDGCLLWGGLASVSLLLTSIDSPWTTDISITAGAFGACHVIQGSKAAQAMLGTQSGASQWLGMMTVFRPFGAVPITSGAEMMGQRWI